MSLRLQLDHETCTVSASKLGVIICKILPFRFSQPVLTVSCTMPKLYFMSKYYKIHQQNENNKIKKSRLIINLLMSNFVRNCVCQCNSTIFIHAARTIWFTHSAYICNAQRTIFCNSQKMKRSFLCDK